MLRNAPTAADLLKQATNIDDKPKPAAGIGIRRNAGQPPVPAPIEHQEASAGIQESAAAIEAPPARRSVSRTVDAEPRSSARKKNEGESELGLQRAWRTGLTEADYGKRSKPHQVYIYNKHVNRWLKNFSDENKDEGGEPIIKNALFEAILDVVIYDMGLEPSGFKNVEEIRNYLRSKLK